MERTGVPLKLQRFIPWLGVRKMVWAHLTSYDREMAKMAQNSKRRPPSSSYFSSYCARNGYISLLAWAKTQGCVLDIWTCEAAASTGQFKMLIWLHLQSPPVPWNGVTLNSAIAHGNLKLVQWLASKACPRGNLIYLDAVRRGHMKLLEWMLEAGWFRLGAPFWYAQEAAKYGQIAVLEWALSEDPAFLTDFTICEYAAIGGHLQTLQWLRDRGCVWDRATRVAAFRNRQLHVLEWAIDNGCPG